MHNLLGPNPKPVSPTAENALSPVFFPEKFVCDGASGTSGVAGSMDCVAVNELNFSHCIRGGMLSCIAAQYYNLT